MAETKQASKECEYHPQKEEYFDIPGGDYISRVVPCSRAGLLNVWLRFYLPEAFGSEVCYRRDWGRWRPARRIEGRDGWWEVEVRHVRPFRELRFRYRDTSGRWQPLAPIDGCENLNGRFSVPPVEHEWQAEPPRTGRAKVVLETTLEGLLGGYGDGIKAPRELQDQLLKPVCWRLLRTHALDRLQENQIDEIMAPVGSSVADRTHLNPKFNYLTYAVGDVDWQLGTPADFKDLLDALYQRGMRLVPDMIFAHMVRQPHAASLDNLRDRDGRALYEDANPYLFRDYGTWMYDLANPQVRKILAARLANFVRRYRLDTVRFDFVDGLVLQYDRRAPNQGEVFLRELKKLMKEAWPGVTVIGEAFSTADRKTVRDTIDVIYCPRGFAVAEEVYRPPSQRRRPLYPDMEPILRQAADAGHTDRREAVYAQLHDEAWEDAHIRRGRPNTPWAYGGLPAELARNCGEELIGARLLQRRDLLDFVRKRVRLVEGFTMFLSNLRYLYLPGVDSLALGRLDEPERWKVDWDDPAALDVAFWRTTGLGEAEIFDLHDQHRRDMRRLRQLFRETTFIKEKGEWPLTRVTVLHANEVGGVICLLRRHVLEPRQAAISLFNFGPLNFGVSAEYMLPIPKDLQGEWQVEFDGDRIDPDLLEQGGLSTGYFPGEAVECDEEGELALEFGAQSVLVLRPAGEVS
ncbi:MAG: hypothetical protein AAGK14_08690 [Verrucomicrobiota bacterium]